MGQFNRLPLEIIVLIFSWLIHLGKPLKEARALTVARAVCETWRTIMDTTPTVWTNLTNAPLPLGLAKSAQLPLTITETGHGEHLTSATMQGSRLHRLVTSAANRIQALYLSNINIDNMTNLLRARSPPFFPQMRHLSLYNVELRVLQWAAIIHGCPGLKRLEFGCLQGRIVQQGAATPEPLIVPQDMELHCCLAVEQSFESGQMFGLQWRKLEWVWLEIEYEDYDFPPQSHDHPHQWAEHWLQTLALGPNDPSPITTIVTLRAIASEEYSKFKKAPPSTEVEVTFAGHPKLFFKLITRSEIEDGLQSTDWKKVRTLTNPIKGNTHLVIRPGQRSMFCAWSASRFVEETRPTTVAIGDPNGQIDPEDHGDWLKRIWVARLKGKGWTGIEKIQCNSTDPGVATWVEEQCTAAEYAALPTARTKQYAIHIPTVS